MHERGSLLLHCNLRQVRLRARSFRSQLVVRSRILPFPGRRWNHKKWPTRLHRSVSAGYHESRIACREVGIPRDLVIRCHAIQYNAETLQATLHRWTSQRHDSLAGTSDNGCRRIVRIGAFLGGETNRRDTRRFLHVLDVCTGFSDDHTATRAWNKNSHDKVKALRWCDGIVCLLLLPS